MYYDFDTLLNRRGTGCAKWDDYDQDVIPMWVADMDFRTPSFIMDALRNRLEHEILGYTYITRSFSQAAAEWIYRRHGWKIRPDWIL